MHRTVLLPLFLRQARHLSPIFIASRWPGRLFPGRKQENLNCIQEDSRRCQLVLTIPLDYITGTVVFSFTTRPMLPYYFTSASLTFFVLCGKERNNKSNDEIPAKHARQVNCSTYLFWLNGPTGRDLWVMVVSSSPFQHMKGKPDVKYVANIHGNEAVSREMALHLIEVSGFYFF